MAYQLRKLQLSAKQGIHWETICERSEFASVWAFAIEMFQECSLNIVGCHYDPPGYDQSPSAEFFVAALGVHETYVIQANPN